MGGIEQLAETVATDMEQRLPGQRKTQRGKLALLVATMLQVRSANLMDVAACLPRPAERLDSRYQWIKRFLANARVVSDAVMAPYQPVDEVLVQSGRRSKRMFTTIRAGMGLWARRTIRMAASAAPSLIGSRISTHQPRATASFGVPAPINRRISSPRLCPATWIR